MKHSTATALAVTTASFAVGLYPLSFVTRRDTLIIVVGMVAAGITLLSCAFLGSARAADRPRGVWVGIGLYLLPGVLLLPLSATAFRSFLGNDSIPIAIFPFLIATWPHYLLFLAYWWLTGGSVARLD